MHAADTILIAFAVLAAVLLVESIMRQVVPERREKISRPRGRSNVRN